MGIAHAVSNDALFPPTFVPISSPSVSFSVLSSRFLACMVVLGDFISTSSGVKGAPRIGELFF